MYNYFSGNKVAGYSGWVIYFSGEESCNISFWMIPGTYEWDWDNQ